MKYSYRREDSAGTTGRLYDRLSDEFGKDQIFMDVESIGLGIDFAQAIERAVGNCEVLVAIIGKDWLTDENRRRLNDPNDYVRLEIVSALTRNILVIPVLIDGAHMPAADELPSDLRPLSRRNILKLSHAHFQTDTDRLVRTLKQIPKPEASPREHPLIRFVVSYKIAWIGGISVLAIALIGVISILVPKTPFFAIGTKVLAPWQKDGCLYPGTVLAAQKDKALIRFDFGEEVWTANAHVYLHRTPLLSDIKLNTDVYVWIESERAWAPGKIKDQRNEKQLVGLNPNTACVGGKTHEWATVGNLLLRN